jgi:hypothetical protein
MINFRKYSLYDATVEEWTSILKLAHQWKFFGIKDLAIRELERLEVPPLRKIVIYHDYAIDRRLLQAAYTAFTIRDKPITIEEGQELGLETVIQLAFAREHVRAPAAGGKRIRDAHSPVNVGGAELDGLIRELFQLPQPDRDPDDHVALRKTGGHAEHESGAQPNGSKSSDSKPAKGTLCEQNPFRCALIVGIGTGSTPDAAANGHANHTPPGGTANVRANGVPKGHQANSK